MGILAANLMKTTGVVYLKIRCELNQDVTVANAQNFVEELDYKIKSLTPAVSVSDTDIVEWGVTSNCNGEED